jgi:RNA polymerase sigma-70 factor (ECF subfamily)
VSEQGVWNFDLDELPYRAQLYRMALRLTRSADDAEDALQDTYLKAFKHYGSFRPGTNLRAWLFKILKNTVINEVRRRQRSPARMAFANIEETPESAFAPFCGAVVRTPEEEFLDASLDGDVLQALIELPHKFRVVVLLADIEGHAYRDIAALLSIPVGTVMSRLYRGRRLLERALLAFAVRYHYLARRPRRLRSSDLDLEHLLGVAAPDEDEDGTGRHVST